MDDPAIRAVPYLLMVILTAIPSWTLFRRIGWSRWWTLLSLIPFGPFIVLWLVAYRRWPR